MPEIQLCYLYLNFTEAVNKVFLEILQNSKKNTCATDSFFHK